MGGEIKQGSGLDSGLTTARVWGLCGFGIVIEPATAAAEADDYGKREEVGFGFRASFAFRFTEV